MKEIDKADVINYIYCVDDTVLDSIEDNLLLNHVDFASITNAVEGYGCQIVSNDIRDTDDIMKLIGGILRDLQPSGYIGKEEAKKILCNFIDDNYITYF